MRAQCVRGLGIEVDTIKAITARRATTGTPICHPVLTLAPRLYNDAKKVTQALLKQGKMLNISFDIQEDLRCFTEELKKTVRVCRTNFNCPPSAYLHSVPVRERCQRCRTLATLKILPDFAHNILKTVVGAIQQDVKETQMYTAPATPQPTSTLQQAAQQVAQQAATQQALLNGLTSTSSAFFPPYQGVGSSFGSYMHLPYRKCVHCDFAPNSAS